MRHKIINAPLRKVTCILYTLYRDSWRRSIFYVFGHGRTSTAINDKPCMRYWGKKNNKHGAVKKKKTVLMKKKIKLKRKRKSEKRFKQ